MNNFFLKHKNGILLLLMIICTACNKADKVKFINTSLPEEYDIYYSKDSIKVIFNNLNTLQTDTAIYVKSENNFFEENNGNKKLFFSVNKDTVYSENDGSFFYKTEIKKNNDSSFKTSTILINDLGKESVLSTFYYNKHYKILRIEKPDAVVFIPE